MVWSSSLSSQAFSNLPSRDTGPTTSTYPAELADTAKIFRVDLKKLECNVVATEAEATTPAATKTAKRWGRKK